MLVAMAVGMSSCNSNSDGPEQTNYFSDFVTFESVTAQGSVFTYRQQDDSELITLLCPSPLNTEEFKLKSRLIITYSTQSNEHGISEAITLLGASNIFGGGAAPVELAADKTDDYASNTITYQGISRTGNYLNIVFSAPYNGKNDAKVNLYVDPETVDNEYPELHIVFGPHSSYYDTMYMFYGSWDISPLWDRTTCKGLKVFANTDEPQHQCTTFTKVNQSIKPAQ